MPEILKKVLTSLLYPKTEIYEILILYAQNKKFLKLKYPTSHWYKLDYERKVVPEQELAVVRIF